MPRISAIGIHDQLTTGQSGICRWPALDKTSCGIDEKLGIPVDHSGRQRRKNHMRKNSVTKLLYGNIFDMLRREDDSADTFGIAVFILDGNLRLPVRQQERQ